MTSSVSWQQTGSSDVPLAGDFDLIDRIGRGHYQAAVILTSFSQSPWPARYLCRVAGVPIRVGMSKEFGGVGLTHWVPSPPDEMHQVDRSLHLERVAAEALRLAAARAGSIAWADAEVTLRRSRSAAAVGGGAAQSARPPRIAVVVSQRRRADRIHQR